MSDGFHYCGRVSGSHLNKCQLLRAQRSEFGFYFKNGALFLALFWPKNNKLLI